MGEGDFMPTGRRRKKADPKHVRKIQEGGKKADLIRKKSNHHHKKVEVPIAEKQLEKDLEELK